jgi:hypothetical protein
MPTTRKYGHGQGYGSGPTPSTIRGKSVDGGDDFYVQKIDRDTADWRQEDSENGLPEPHGPKS